MDPEEDPAVKKYLSMLGKRGAAARARNLTPRQRKMIAKKAGQASQAARSPQERNAAARKAARARWGRKRKA